MTLFVLGMFKNHIERLKSKISEMEDSRVASDALQRANQERLEHQERTIASNALLLEALRMQHANVLADKVSLNLTIDNNALLLQTVPAEHAAALQARQEARDTFVAEVARLRAENDALVIETTSLKFERNACKKKKRMPSEVCFACLTGEKKRLTLQCCVVQ
jgi:hypothetical protein